MCYHHYLLILHSNLDYMAKQSILLNISEIQFVGVDISEKKRKLMMSDGTLRKIISKVYTTNMDDSLENIVRRNIFRILGFLYPYAVISHRSAFELKPTNEGDIYLTYNYTNNSSLKISYTIKRQ